MQTTAFGGGCHWCAEAVFQALKGVRAVRQGFARANAPDDGWSEAVEVDFDPSAIRPDQILAVHLATHASTANHRMRGKYRSAVYVLDPEQGAEMQAALEQARAETHLDFVTRVLAHRGFKPSAEVFRNYYATDPERPFCRTYIDPKLVTLRARFAHLLNNTRETR